MWGLDCKLVEDLASRFQAVLEVPCCAVRIDAWDFVEELPVTLGVRPERLTRPLPHLSQGVLLFGLLVAGDEMVVKGFFEFFKAVN